MRNGLLIVAAALALSACGGERDAAAGEAETAADDSDAVTITSEEGDVTATTGGGSSVGGLPTYPGARTHANVSVDARDGGSGDVVGFETDDSPETVIAFYREALESRGYTIDTEISSGQMQVVAATRDHGASGAHVTATATGAGSTTVSVVISEEGE